MQGVDCTISNCTAAESSSLDRPTLPACQTSNARRRPRHPRYKSVHQARSPGKDEACRAICRHGVVVVEMIRDRFVKTPTSTFKPSIAPDPERGLRPRVLRTRRLALATAVTADADSNSRAWCCAPRAVAGQDAYQAYRSRRFFYLHASRFVRSGPPRRSCRLCQSPQSP